MTNKNNNNKIEQKIKDLGFNVKALEDPAVYGKVKNLLQEINDNKKEDEELALKLLVFFIIGGAIAFIAFKTFFT